jgi:mRNA interferase MazF
MSAYLGEVSFATVVSDANPDHSGQNRAAEIVVPRPCLIVSPDELNQHLRTIIITPMTTAERPYPRRVHLTLQGKRGHVAVDQLRAVRGQRLVHKLGKVSAKTARAVSAVLVEMFIRQYLVERERPFSFALSQKHAGYEIQNARRAKLARSAKSAPLLLGPSCGRRPFRDLLPALLAQCSGPRFPARQTSGSSESFAFLLRH